MHSSGPHGHRLGRSRPRLVSRPSVDPDSVVAVAALDLVAGPGSGVEAEWSLRWRVGLTPHQGLLRESFPDSIRLLASEFQFRAVGQFERDHPLPLRPQFDLSFVGRLDVVEAFKTRLPMRTNFMDASLIVVSPSTTGFYRVVHTLASSRIHGF